MESRSLSHPRKLFIYKRLYRRIVTMCFHFHIIAFSFGVVNCTSKSYYSITIAEPVISDYKEKQRKSAAVAKTIYNVSFGIIVFVVGLVMIFLEKINNDTLNSYLGYLDPLLRYMFGGLCLVYGIFRLYRGIKKEY